MVRRVMRFMIFRQRQKPDVPVKREELTKIMLHSYKGQKTGKLTTNILRLAAAKFPPIFGMEMKEITLKTQTKHGARLAPPFHAYCRSPVWMRLSITATLREKGASCAQHFIPGFSRSFCRPGLL